MYNNSGSEVLQMESVMIKQHKMRQTLFVICSHINSQCVNLVMHTFGGGVISQTHQEQNIGCTKCDYLETDSMKGDMFLWSL